MRKNYDFSKAEKNPYYKKLKGKKTKAEVEVSLDLKDLVQIEKKAKSRQKLSETIQKLEKRIAALEAKNKKSVR